MDRPRPVPPNLRLMVPSACWKASKMVRSCSGGMPMPVSVTSNASTPSATVSAGVVKRSSARRRMASVTSPDEVNLTAFDSRLRSTCCSRCWSETSVRGTSSEHPDREPQVLLGGERAERRLDVLDDPGHGDVGGVDVHLAGLDLGQVEDVVDQLQQVRAGAVDGLRELHLPAVEVAVGVVGQQLGEDQQRVERGPQLVRHVREELRLVARRQRELLGAVLERPAGVLDLEVLDLDGAVLLGQQARLLLQLGVALLQLALLRLQLARLVLQLGGEPLRLHEQGLGAGAGDDRVQRDADDLHQLLEELQVHDAERPERRELHDAEHLLLEQRPAGSRWSAARPRPARRRS